MLPQYLHSFWYTLFYWDKIFSVLHVYLGRTNFWECNRTYSAHWPILYVAARPPHFILIKNYPGSINLIPWLYSDDGTGFIGVNALIRSADRLTDLNSKAISSSKKKKKTETDKSLAMNLVKLISLLRILNELTNWPSVFSILYGNGVKRKPNLMACSLLLCFSSDYFPGLCSGILQLLVQQMFIVQLLLIDSFAQWVLAFTCIHIRMSQTWLQYKVVGLLLFFFKHYLTQTCFLIFFKCCLSDIVAGMSKTTSYFTWPFFFFTFTCVMPKTWWYKELCRIIPNTFLQNYTQLH